MILTDDETVLSSIRMFIELDLLKTFQIDKRTLSRYILSVKKNYRPVIYHNWRHAFNVAQTMFSMLTVRSRFRHPDETFVFSLFSSFKTGRINEHMSSIEQIGLLIACLSHDLDHRGTNNAFQAKVDAPLAKLYTTSTLEHHHFDQCIMILQTEGNNILQALSPTDYKSVVRIIESAILSTDLALYFRFVDFLVSANEKRSIRFLLKETRWLSEISRTERTILVGSCEQRFVEVCFRRDIVSTALRQENRAFFCSLSFEEEWWWPPVTLQPFVNLGKSNKSSLN